MTKIISSLTRAATPWLGLALRYHQRLPEQLRQPRDIDGDRSRLVLREYLRLPGLIFVVAGVEVGKGPPVGVPDDVAAGHRVSVPGRWEAAWWFCHCKSYPLSWASGGVGPAKSPLPLTP